MAQMIVCDVKDAACSEKPSTLLCRSAMEVCFFSSSDKQQSAVLIKTRLLHPVKRAQQQLVKKETISS